jgi:hypothetical protein
MKRITTALLGVMVALVAGVVPVFTPVGALLILGLLMNFVGWLFSTMVLLVAPFLAGGVAGYFWWGRHLRTYALYGLIVGVLAGVMVMLVLKAVNEERTMGVFILVGFSMATLFLSGMLFGDLEDKSRRWRATGGPTPQEVAHFSEQPVARLARASGSGNLSPSMTLFIQALGPGIIGFVGTITTTLISVLLTGGG